MKCLICNNEYKSNAGLGKHIKVSHHLTTQEYYDIYIDNSLSNKYCSICGKENKFNNFIVGYNLGCCTEHTNLLRYGATNVYASEYAKQKMKQTKLKRYGNPNYNNRNKAIETTLREYGVTNISQAPEVKKKIQNTNMKKLGVPMPYLSKAVQERMCDTKEKRYGDRHYTNREKCYNTMKKKGFISKDERVFETVLIDNSIEYTPQYHKDPRYPFYCDFYLPKYDMFIEINIYPAHGPHPFDSNNQEDIEYLKVWQEKANKGMGIYLDWINRWTNVDVNKRTTAKQNRLNYFELYSLEEIQKFFKDELNIIVDINNLYHNL